MRILLILCLACLFTGCFQVYSDNDDLRTVPVTNNPTIVPNYGPLPGMGSG